MRSRLKNMKIRTKLTLWYILITAALFGVFLPIFYHIFAESLLDGEKSNITAAIGDVGMDIQFIDGEVTIRNEKGYPSNMRIAVWDEEGNLLYQNTHTEWFFSVINKPDEFTKVRYDKNEWLIMDRIIEKESGNLRVRICSSLEGMVNALRQTFIIILAALPFYFLIMAVGGFIISRNALQPVSRITDLAKEIERGDLSRRITGMESADEVGELADTFNEMLTTLEKSFEREKSFASDASHELRTPVAVIMSNAEVILDSNPGDETQKSASAILEESKRMNAIIRQLLMLTRGLEGKYKLQFEDTNINQVIEAVLEQLQTDAQGRSISLINETVEELTFNADQSLITQMMINLIRNAIGYGKKGGYVKVKAQRDGDSCLITIADDGIGIPEEEQPLIFNRFYRIDTSRDRRGSGLGLSIVQWIVDEHGGGIELQSAPGEGSVFSVRFNMRPLRRRG